MAKSTKKREMNDISVFGINNLSVRTPSVAKKTNARTLSFRLCTYCTLIKIKRHDEYVSLNKVSR